MTVYAMNANPDFILTGWELPPVDGHDLSYFSSDANTPAWAASMMTDGRLILDDNSGESTWKIIFPDDPTSTAFSASGNVLCMRGDGTTIPEYIADNYFIYGNPPFYDEFAPVAGA